MTSHALLAALATLVSTAFALSTAERYQRNHRRHELMWTISFTMFALGSLGLWAGAAIGWGEWTYKMFFLFGAVLNVPFLALGTVYLLAEKRTADISAGAVSIVAAFAAGVIVSAPLIGPINPTVLPQGSAVFGIGPRMSAAIGSGIASIVIIGGATWSAWRLWSSWRSRGPHVGVADPYRPSPRRLALANVLIAFGTLVSGAAGLFNSVADAMDAFAIALVVGIAIIFAGFLLTNTEAPPPVIEPWHLPDDLAADLDADVDPADRADDPPGRPLPRSGEDHPSRQLGGRGADETSRTVPLVDRSDTRPGSPSLN